jgi:hypothetical protein
MLELLRTIAVFCATFGTCYQSGGVVLQVPVTPDIVDYVRPEESYPRYLFGDRTLVLVPESSV